MNRDSHFLTCSVLFVSKGHIFDVSFVLCSVLFNSNVLILTFLPVYFIYFSKVY